jgi:hypothetical protein
MSDELDRRGANDRITISRSELERMIDDHCDVRLSKFGIDWESTEGVREFISDQLFLRRLRHSMERAHNIGFLTMIGAMVSGTLALIWAAIKNKQ